jgi:excisionase family DNA binding protein
VKGAAEFLDVSDSTVRRLVRSEELYALRVGVQLRFEQGELERYAAAHGDRSRGVGLPSDSMEIPIWAEERVARWRTALERLLPDPKQTQVIVIDRRGAKAFSMLRPAAFEWGRNLWHSTALCLQSDAVLRARFEGQEVVVFEEMIQRGRDVEGVRKRLEQIGLKARSVALIRERSKFLEGRVADPHLHPIEDLDEQEYPEAAAFISRLFDYCEPPLDPEHVVVSGDLDSPAAAEDIREQLQESGLVGVVWNRQSIEDSLVAAVTIDRPQFFDTAALALPEGLSANWDAPCKIRIYISSDGRRVTLSFITFPTLDGDRQGWEHLVDRTWERYGASEERPERGEEGPSAEELERAYVDVCTDLSVELLRQAVSAGIPDTLGMNDLKGPRVGELNAFFGTTRGAEMRKQVNDALQPDKRPKLRLPPKGPVALFVDPDRPMSVATDPEHAQRCIVKALPSRHKPTEPGGEPPHSVEGIGYLELIRALRPLEEGAVSNGLDGLLDGVRAKPVNVVASTQQGWSIKRGFIGSELGEDGPYDARAMRRTQAISLSSLKQWLGRLGKEDETEIHVAKLLVNLVHDWGEESRPLAIEPYPYKHGYMPGVDSKVPWRSEDPKYFLRELGETGLVRRRRHERSVRYSIAPGIDVEKFSAMAELTGHERSQLKALVRAYALIQKRCKVSRRRDPGDPALVGEFSDPLIVLSSARNEQIAYTCALFEVEDWIRTGRRLFEALNAHGGVEPASGEYRDAVRARAIPFAQAARFLFEKLSMYEAVPELRKQLVELFESEGIDAGDILLETIDTDARFAQSYEESDHPVGLLKEALPVLRSFSSFVRQVLTAIGLEEDTRSKSGREMTLADGTKVAKDMDFYAGRIAEVTDGAELTAAIRRSVDAAKGAEGDAVAEAKALERLGTAFELVVAALESQIRSDESLRVERGRKDRRHGDLIDVARRLEAHPGLGTAKTVIAVGDVFNFMGTVGAVAELAGSSDTEIAGGLQTQMAKAVEAATGEAGVVAHISSDTCVLAAEDVDQLLGAVEAVNDAFRVELAWDSSVAGLAYMRFGIGAIDGGYLESLVAAMKLGDGSGFKRGTIALTEAAYDRLSGENAKRCACEDHEEGPRTYRIAHSEESTGE